MKKILGLVLGLLFILPAFATETPSCGNFDIERIVRIGSPSITSNGIYTTTASYSYIRTPDTVRFSTASEWSFKWRFTYHPASGDQGIMSGDGATNVQAIIDGTGRPRFSFGDGTSWSIGAWNDSSISFRYQDGVTYDNEIYFDGTRYGYKVDGVEIGGKDASEKAADTYFAIGVERGRTANQHTRAEWDLNYTSLTLDGVEQLPWCPMRIAVATNAYNTTKFSPVVTALNGAIATIKSVVTNTINQAAAVESLQNGKQTMPDASATNGTCPNYKQCLLVETSDGTPQWFVITDPFRDFVTPILANNTAPSSTTETTGYTQLEYIESTGTQWIDTGITVTANNTTKLRIEIDGDRKSVV